MRSSVATPYPTNKGNRWTAPNEGTLPKVISGKPKVADSSAIRRSHAIASSSPPPSAKPWTAAILASGELAIRCQHAVGAFDKMPFLGTLNAADVLDVGARTKGFVAQTGNYEDAHVPIHFRGVEGLFKRLKHVRIDRVHHLGSI